MNQHEKARLLLEERSLGIIEERDSEWLAVHLADCEQCADAEAELNSTMLLLRSEPVTAPMFLVSRTRTGVRIRARELQEEAERSRMLLLSVALALVFSSLTVWGGWLALSVWGWSVTSGTGAVMSAFAALWFWLAPTVLLLLVMMPGRNEWLKTLQQMGTGRGIADE